MARKVSFTTSLLYETSDSKSISSSTCNWLWPSCKHPARHPFREEEKRCDGNETLSGRSSLQLDSSESCFSGSSEEETSAAAEAAAAVLAVARRMGADRLFFEPGRTRSLVDEEAARTERLQFMGNIAVELDSKDPFSDFRLSMEEVVLANGETKVQWLEEMLSWYLKMNAKSHQAIIVEAFLDLLATLTTS